MVPTHIATCIKRCIGDRRRKFLRYAETEYHGVVSVNRYFRADVEQFPYRMIMQSLIRISPAKAPLRWLTDPQQSADVIDAKKLQRIENRFALGPKLSCTWAGFKNRRSARCVLQ